MVPQAARPHVQLVATLSPTDGISARRIEAAIEHGVDSLVYRVDDTDHAHLHGAAFEVRQRVERRGGTFIVHGRPSLAATLSVRHLHVGQRAIVRGDVRALERGRCVGVSVHNLEEANAAVALGASWLTFGNVYETTSHPDRPARGTVELEALVGAVGVPVIAIGGITADNVAAVLATGCAGVAVIRAILDAPSAADAANALRTAADASPWTPRFTLDLGDSNQKENLT